MKWRKYPEKPEQGQRIIFYHNEDNKLDSGEFTTEFGDNTVIVVENGDYLTWTNLTSYWIPLKELEETLPNDDK